MKGSSVNEDQQSFAVYLQSAGVKLKFTSLTLTLTLVKKEQYPVLNC